MKLAIKNLSKSFDFEVFSNLNISFDSNLIHLVGENGSGKSTLLKIIFGKIKKDSGIFIYNDRKVSQSYLANHSVLVDQDINLFLDESVKMNIKKITNNLNSNLITDFGFKDLLDKKVEELSGGWKKKLMLLLAFMREPDILMLDEYSNFLDEEFIEKINEYIINYSKEHLVIYIDHNQDIGGKVKDIKNVDDKVEDAKYKRKYDKFIYAPIFNKFIFVSFFIMLIVITFLQSFYTTNTLTDKEIYGNYCIQNDMWFHQLTDSGIDEYNDNLFYFGNIKMSKIKINGLGYVDDIFFPLEKESSISDDNECYVFDIYSDYYESYITYNDTQYFVKGIIDLDTTLYQNLLTYPFLNTLIVKGNIESFRYVCSMIDSNEMVNAYMNVYVNELLYIGYTDSYFYWKVFLGIFIIYTILFVAFSTIRNKKDFSIYLSYKNANIKLFMKNLHGIIIISIFVGILSYIISYYMSLNYLSNVEILNGYDLSFIRPFKMIIIGLILNIVLYCISNFFFVVKKKKEN